MNYIEKNKEAWEEAFDNRINGWGDIVVENLQASSAYYIQPALQAELDQLHLAGKQDVYKRQILYRIHWTWCRETRGGMHTVIGV